MTVSIKKLSHDRYTVNGKLIVKDMNDNWVGHQELTTKEVSLFQKHINAIENCHPELET